jgi:hypothetical protein
MYLDTNGYVTVGVGHMIGHCGDAAKLNFVLRQGGGSATADQIATDFNKVSGQAKGQLCTHYQQFTLLDMPANAIDALLDADIAEKEQAVRQRFRGYDTYPPQAKTACWIWHLMSVSRVSFRNFRIESGGGSGRLEYVR